MELELISFPLCPYVQRSVITLKYKNAPFKLTNIDLKKKPQWFLDISPMGKVPVLRVNATHSIFESAVINEYIDETVGNPLMAKDPLQRALERAWIEFGSRLLASLYALSMERALEELESKTAELFIDLARIEQALKGRPYFRGSEFSLVDTSWAPLFMRIFLSPRLRDDARWSNIPKVRSWAEELLKVSAVQESVEPGFSEIYADYCRDQGSLLY